MAEREREQKKGEKKQQRVAGAVQTSAMTISRVIQGREMGKEAWGCRSEWVVPETLPSGDGLRVLNIFLCRSSSELDMDHDEAIVVE